ncbi:MAG: archease [Anaerolineaceae bacterium]|nr:archease [Anaerolineaceae bacterium]
MNSNKSDAGFVEVIHTADLAIRVWAPDYKCLLITALKAMYSLMDINLIREEKVFCNFTLEAEDLEGMLVAFLSEFLFMVESENLAFDQVDLIQQGNCFSVQAEGSLIEPMYNEIKAVTYHNLSVDKIEEGFEVTIVFDV